jgi:hypothetical protein
MRYEVRYGSITAAGFSGVHDITDLRTSDHSAGEGLVWSIQSIGYVYKRVAAAVPFNQLPNQVLATSKMRTEIRRLGLALPANAAVIVNNGSNVSVTNNAEVNGGSYGIAYYSGSAPAPLSGAKITGGSTQLIDPQGMSMQSIFAATPNEMQARADLVADPTALPDIYPADKVVYINGNATFDAAHRLNGSGLLIVNGSLTVPAGSNAYFSGVIYVTGDVSISGPAQLSGALIAQGNFSLSGGIDVATIQYDPTVLNSLRQQMSAYAVSRNSQYEFSATATR